jgi:adhesin HecA-like repeat protein
MKKLVVLCVWAFLPISAVATPILTIQGPTTVSQGSSLAVDVNIASVTDLYGFQFDLGFNPSVLMATVVSEGAFLPSGGSTFFIPGTIDNTNGIVAATADTLISAMSGVTGSGTLAVFDFTAIANGATGLTLSNVILVDSNGNLINTVANSPEPNALILFAVTLLGALGFRRKASGYVRSI